MSNLVQKVESLTDAQLAIRLGIDGRRSECREHRNALLSFVVKGLHDGEVNRSTPLREVIEHYRETEVAQLRLPLGVA